MVSATHEIQARVQHLVMEYGEYVPVELLLATSRLCYDDYRAWREGGLETLDDVLADHSCVVRKLFRDAALWARELGLEPEPADNHAWGDNAGAVLSASADPQLNELLCTRFRRANDGGQADIFLDTASTRALTELIQSLVAGCAIMARDALDRLLRVDSGHRQRDNAGVLIKVLEMSLPDGASDGSAWLERMEREWIPLHRTCLVFVPGIFWPRFGGKQAGRSRRRNSTPDAPLAMLPGRIGKGSTGKA